MRPAQTLIRSRVADGRHRGTGGTMIDEPACLVWYDVAMQYVVEAVPFLLIAGIVGLVSASFVRRRLAFKRPTRAPRSKKLTLHVTHRQMDDDLNDLIRRS